MKFAQIKETCIYFRDLEMAREFYHTKLGLPIIGYVESKHIFFRAGSSVLLCFNPDDSKTKKSPPAHYADGKYHFAFEVAAEDYETQKKELADKGIVVTQQLKWNNGQESFYFEDPIGNVLEIVPAGIWDRA
jgi:catechol 2,3-dioxygenase-like lactoylglutathione lyase family enzyme